jgi:hypothetical protein
MHASSGNDRKNFPQSQHLCRPANLAHGTKMPPAPQSSFLPEISGVFGLNFAKREISPGTLTTTALT